MAQMELRFKKMLESKVCSEVWDNCEYGSDYIPNNSITIKWGRLTYEISFSAWVSTYMKDWEENRWNISRMDIGNVYCHVADYNIDEDEGFEAEQNMVLEFLDGLTIRE